jgi:hypothetical protein
VCLFTTLAARNFGSTRRGPLILSGYGWEYSDWLLAPDPYICSPRLKTAILFLQGTTFSPGRQGKSSGRAKLQAILKRP